MDRASGEVVRWEPFSSYTRGRQLRSILRFAHTGEVLGIVGQTVAGLVSIGGASAGDHWIGACDTSFSCVGCETLEVLKAGSADVSDQFQTRVAIKADVNVILARIINKGVRAA